MSGYCRRSTIRAPDGSSEIFHRRSRTSGWSTACFRLKPNRWGTHRPDRASRRRDMADPTRRELKLIQYLNEAYSKEKELETALQAHIAMTTRKPYKKRLQDHLKETKGHARGVERRIKQLGGKAEVVPAPGPVADAASAVTGAASKAVSAAKGPLHTLRGTGEQEK